MITKTEQAQIKQLLQTPQWSTAEAFAEKLIQQITEQPSMAGTQWQTLQNILGKEGQIHGIRRFIQELYTQAQQL